MYSIVFSIEVVYHLQLVAGSAIQAQCYTFPLVLLSGTSENGPRTSKKYQILALGQVEVTY